jgi:DNA repair photolyase
MTSNDSPLGDSRTIKTRKGRGSHIDPRNRFEATHREFDRVLESWDEHELDRTTATQVIVDRSKAILTKNSSPDVGFDYSVNCYRGCEHGCAYCFARPTHELLSFNAGLDFESKIVIKPDAPQLLRQALMKPSWQANVIAMSGVTDCYQPLEKKYKLTRGCLEVLDAFNNPTAIITKNVLILRDLDILARMAAKSLVHVNVSVTTLDSELARKLEPRTPPPRLRLEAIRRLSEAGVPVNVLIAPIIPGLTDKELPRILETAAEAGARSAEYVLLRLPLAVEPIFLDWLERHYPLRADHVKALVRATRGGEYYEAGFGKRMVGQGAFAQQLSSLFRVFAQRYGLAGELPPYDFTRFSRPGQWVQRELFPDESGPVPGTEERFL